MSCLGIDNHHTLFAQAILSQGLYARTDESRVSHILDHLGFRFHGFGGENHHVIAWFKGFPRNGILPVFPGIDYLKLLCERRHGCSFFADFGNTLIQLT